MKKIVTAAAIASLFSAPAFALDAEQETRGHRVGLGFNSITDVYGGGSHSMDNGLKLEYGYEFNRIVGLNVSYSGYKSSNILASLNGAALKVDTDLGYTFYHNNFSIKPFASLGYAQIAEDIDTVIGDGSYDDGNIFAGIGVRANYKKNFYAAMRMDYLTFDLAEYDQFSLTLGYRF